MTIGLVNARDTDLPQNRSLPAMPANWLMAGCRAHPMPGEQLGLV